MSDHPTDSSDGQLSTRTRAQRSGFHVWGLTGGIASGKSTVARMFEDQSIPVIDADLISRQLSEPGGAAYDAILQRFCTADRAKLRDLVFSDPEAKQDLEAILHPLIRAESFKRMQALAAQGHTVIVYEAALLVETGRYKDFDGLLVVEAPREVRKRRLIERDAITPELAEKIIASQVPEQVRRKAATLVVENSGSLADLLRQVEDLAARLKKLA